MRRKICNALICLGLALGIGGTSVYAYSQVSVENHFTTGVIDIELNEYTIQDGAEVLWTNSVKNILPGQDVYKIPRILNEGNNCYIRAEVSFVNSSLTMKSVYGMPEQWLLAEDGYYYYTEVLESGESIDLFEGFKVPKDFNQKMEASLFEIRIRIDAVQSDNFTPDYNADEPWGNVEILNCTKEDMYDLTTFKKPEYLKFRIMYDGTSERLLKNEEDFFENFPVMLPGDVFSDKLEFNNESEKSVNLYFRTKALEGTELLEKVRLKITKKFKGDEMIIYDGVIRGTDLQENILLATVNSKETGYLSYEIYVPETLDNAYTLMEDNVIWIFSTEPVNEIDAVPTGDQTLQISLTMLGAGLALIMTGLGIGVYGKVRARNER